MKTNVIRLIAVVTALVLVVSIWSMKSRATARAAGQLQLFDSGCVSLVPREWGTYRGGSAQSGLSFEDSTGTLRFVTNLPCGATPTVALEVRRTAKN